MTTYTSGAHAQSVAMVLKQAGASKVSILTVARWLEMEKEPVKQFYIEKIGTKAFNPMICPWTSEACPP
jgi:hypothetical protein